MILKLLKILLGNGKLRSIQDQNMEYIDLFNNHNVEYKKVVIGQCHYSHNMRETSNDEKYTKGSWMSGCLHPLMECEFCEFYEPKTEFAKNIHKYTCTEETLAWALVSKTSET